MSHFTITGGIPLQGTVNIHGAKNSVLPILAATVLCPGISIIHNCPPLSDVTASIAILEHLGCRVTQKQTTVTVDARFLTNTNVPDELMREMRSSIIFLGAILGRAGHCEMSYPGGCELGPRPIDLHLSALRTLGADIVTGPEGLVCTAPYLMGREITLSFPSVGATENAMLAAVTAKGVTTITNAAREPEIVDLQQFLQSIGAKVLGAGTSVITVVGSQPLHDGEHTVIGDRIAAATYLAATAATQGSIHLRGIDYRHLSTVTSVFAEAGCIVSSTPHTISLCCNKPLRAVPPIRTGPYPGFPTDAQAPIMAGLCTAAGSTIFVETIFSSRYRHVDELRRMGADIRTEGQVAILTGVDHLHSASVCAHDLRGGAALVVAALSAQGTSTVTGLHHIDRGYDRLEQNLTALGADIKRIT